MYTPLLHSHFFLKTLQIPRYASHPNHVASSKILGFPMWHANTVSRDLKTTLKGFIFGHVTFVFPNVVFSGLC